MDLVNYTLNKEDLETINRVLSDFRKSLLPEYVVPMDDGGLLVAFSPNSCSAQEFC